MATASNGSIVAQICTSLRSQLGMLFECLPAGERVQIRTPFVYPDGDSIDLYWRDTPKGDVVSDLGDTRGWLFVNGANSELTSKQEQAFDEACSNYGVERLDEILLTRVEDGDLALAIVKLAQAITMVSQTVDVGQPPAVTSKEITANRIIKAFEIYGLKPERNVKLRDSSAVEWKVDFVVRTDRRNVALMALHGRKQFGWQRRAIEHAYTAFSALAQTWKQESVPHEPMSVIDDTDTVWNREPIAMLRDVSKVVYLSEPEQLGAAIRN